MRCIQRALAALSMVGLMAAVSDIAFAQSSEPSASPAAAAQTRAPIAPPGDPGATVPPPQAAAPVAEPAAPSSTPAAPAKKTYTVPAGTKVLLQLRSAVNTHSAKPGDGVYLASSFPVVVGNPAWSRASPGQRNKP